MNAITDTDAMIINEARRLDRAVKGRAATLKQLEAQLKSRPSMLERRPKRYSLEFDFTPPADAIANDGFVPELGAPLKSFVVDGGTKFFCATIETSVRVIGEFSDGSTVQPITRPYCTGDDNRQRFIEFFWKIRDTGADREWQNMKQPSVFLMSGSLSPLFLPIHGVVRGGSEIAVEVEPVSAFFGSTNLFNSVSTVSVHFSFHGHEVIG